MVYNANNAKTNDKTRNSFKQMWITVVISTPVKMAERVRMGTTCTIVSVQLVLLASTAPEVCIV